MGELHDVNKQLLDASKAADKAKIVTRAKKEGCWLTYMVASRSSFDALGTIFALGAANWAASQAMRN